MNVPAALPLLPHHLTDLRASGLSDAQVTACGFRSVTDPAEVVRLLGWSNRSRAAALGPCLALPFVGADGKPTGYVRLKPDRPRASARDGKRIKYESPVGRPNRVYIPPGTRAALADLTVPLILTEGEKKAAKADQDGFACVGLVGVWGWQRKRDRGPDGRATGRRELVPDLDAVAWAGRAVFLAYDSDLADKPEVQAAERALAAALAGRAAAVRLVRLPARADGAKVGLDDYLLTHSPADLRAILAAAEPPDPPPAAPDPGDGRGPFLQADDDPHRLARLFLAGFDRPDGPTLRYWRADFLLWADGVYSPLPPADLTARLTAFARRQLEADAARRLAEWQAKDEHHRGPAPAARKVTRAMVADALQAAGGECLLPAGVAAPAWLAADPWPAAEVLAAPNGLVHLPAAAAGRPGAVRPPTPRFFTLARLAAPFDPAAPPPRAWLDFLHAVWPDDPASADCLQDWFGYLLTPDTRQQKILLLVGPKRAGKGTVTGVLRGLLGADSVAGPTLNSLATNFGLAPLLGKPVAVPTCSGKCLFRVIVHIHLNLTDESRVSR